MTETPQKIDDGGPATLSLASGELVRVSAADFEKVNLYAWRLGANGYIYRLGGRKKGDVCLLHRYIMDAKPGEEIHHRNEDRRDNQRANLEVTNARDHQRNHHSHVVAARNRASRIYPLTRTCLGCGEEFTVHRDHRGRNRYCSKLCGNRNRRKQDAK